MEPLFSHTDVTSIMTWLSEIRDDVRPIRREIVEDDGEEEESDGDV